MQLTQRSRLQNHHCRRDGRGGGEVARIDDRDGAAGAGDLDGRVLGEVVGVGGVAAEGAVGRVDAAVADVALEDVGVGGGDGVEDGGVDA